MNENLLVLFCRLSEPLYLAINAHEKFIKNKQNNMNADWCIYVSGQFRMQLK